MYKKRAKKCYNSGKSHKKDSNKSERQFEKEEVRDEMKEIEDGYKFRYKHASKKKRTKEQKIEKDIRWYEHFIERYTRANFIRSSHCKDLFFNLVHSYKSKVKKLKEKLESIRSDK